MPRVRIVKQEDGTEVTEDTAGNMPRIRIGEQQDSTTVSQDTEDTDETAGD